VKAKQVYLHFAEQCERAATATDLLSTSVAMLAAADVWRRLAASYMPREVEVLKGSKETRERGLLVGRGLDERDSGTTHRFAFS